MHAGRSGRATITHVAQLAGVSISTASKVLSGKGRVAPLLSERVQTAAGQLGYSPDGLAQALRTGRAQILGLHVPFISHYTVSAISEGVLEAAYAAGYAVAMCAPGFDSAREHRHLEALVRQRVAATITMPAAPEAEPYLAMQARGIPVVFVQRRPPGIAADLVASDYRGGTREAVRHLLGLGRRRVALLAPFSTFGTNDDRAAGYREGYAEAGLTPPPGLALFDLRTVDDVFAATRALLTGATPPDALIASGSTLLAPALACLRRLGARVPDDVALVGAGDVEWAYLAEPALSMTEIDGREVGRLAVQLALERLAEDGARPPRTVYVPTTLMVRSSSAGGLAAPEPMHRQALHGAV
ncbi:MAG: LacI family DNA-binding transcriptional regulator [Chloroflexota bacterium]